LGVYSENGNSIMDYTPGWKLDAGSTTSVYDIAYWGRALGLLRLDMHCVPPASSDVFDPLPSYSRANEGELTSITPDLTPNWGAPTTAGPKDGPVTVSSVSCHRTFLSDRTHEAKYIRTGNWLTVRLRLVWTFDYSAGSALEINRNIHDAMANVWNDGSVPKPTGSADKLLFRCERVISGEDHVVKMYRTFPRANYLAWPSGIEYNRIAHEIGHHFGLVDEYYLGADPNKQSVADQIKTEQEYCPWRYQERSTAGACGATKNLMEDDWRRATPNSTLQLIIDQKIIDAIDQQRQQGLCLRT
jgi:hypothetical protein